MKHQKFRKIRFGMSMVLLPSFVYWAFREAGTLRSSDQVFGCSTAVEDRVFSAFLVIYLLYGLSFVPQWIDSLTVLRGKHDFVWEAKPPDYERAIERSIATTSYVNP